MKTLKQAALAALMLCVFSVSLFAGGFALSGIGSRAIGMGGAFRGLADDATAMYWNPAGLGFMETDEMAVGLAGIAPDAKFKNSNASLPGFSTKNEQAVRNFWPFPSAFGVKTDTKDLKYGVGVYVPYGLGATWHMFNLPTTMPGAGTVHWSEGFPREAMKSAIAVVDIHPTIAYPVTDMISLGAGMSIQYGSIEIDKVKPHPTQSYYVPTTVHLKGTGLGIGANLGALVKATDKLQIGLSGKLPSSIDIKGDADIKTWLNDAVNYGMHGNNPAYFTPAILRSKYDANATLKLPGDVGLGFSYKVSQLVRMNLDLAYTMWSRLDKVKIELDSVQTAGPALTETELNTQWKDTFRVSAGTEYKNMDVALRAGVFYDQSPIPDKSLSPTWPDTSDKISINAGFGYNIGPVVLDANFEHIYFIERKVNTPTADNMVGEYETKINAANVSLTYKF